jgi:hypothetical protein
VAGLEASGSRVDVRAEDGGQTRCEMEKSRCYMGAHRVNGYKAMSEEEMKERE